MSEDLVKRLRHAAKFGGIYGEAADRIEEQEPYQTLSVALQKQIKNLQAINKEMYDNHTAKVKELQKPKQ